MQDGGRPPLEMPYLEPVSVSSDVWDENWFPLQTLKEHIGIGQDSLHLDTVASSSQTSSHEGGSPSLQSKEQQVWHFAVAEETWDDVWPFLDHMDMTRTTVENSEFPIQEKMGEVLEPIGGLKPSAEQSHLEPNPNKIPPNEVQFLESPPASASLTSAPVSSDKQNGEVIQEKVKNEDLSGTQVITLNSSNSCTNRGTEKQNSLILAAELQVSKRLYIPRSSPTAALGAAARLATSNGLFHWLSVLRKLET
uniref:Uncharacterized protein n=2 Tax=Pelodiscus sinensis TaxID=13735 RepID=K7FVQ2_PELSI